MTRRNLSEKGGTFFMFGALANQNSNDRFRRLLSFQINFYIFLPMIVEIMQIYEILK